MCRSAFYEKSEIAGFLCNSVTLAGIFQINNSTAPASHGGDRDTALMVKSRKI